MRLPLVFKHCTAEFVSCAEHKELMLRVVVFRTGQLGDTVCAIPAFRLLRSHFHDAELCLLCDEPVSGNVAAREIAEQLNIFDRIVTYRSMRGWRTWAELLAIIRKLRPDVLVQLPQLNKSYRRMAKQRLFFRLAGVRRLRGFHPPTCTDERHPNEPSRLVQLLNAEGVSGEKPDYAFPVNEDAISSLDTKMQGVGIEKESGYIVFCGGGKAPTQRWPLDRYAAVLERLSLESGLPVMGIGGASDLEAYERQIKPRFAGMRVLNEPLPMNELAALLRRAVCYIGNDTGPMHLAAAVGCPVIAIISARNRLGQWDPDVEPRLLIRYRTECEGCWLRECNQHQHLCMNAITVDEVVTQAVPFVKKLRS